MIQNRDNDKSQRLAALLRPCAGVAVEWACIHGIEEQPVCGLSGAQKPLPCERSVRQDDFAFGELSQAFWLPFFWHA